MKKLIQTSIFLLFSMGIGVSSVSAQSVLDLSEDRHICSFAPDDKLPSELYSFASSKEADELVASILSTVGLAPRFKVLAANVPNAAAVIQDEDRLIVYSESWIQQTVSSNRWGAVALLAHEIAHHLNGHTLEAGGSRPLTELEADKFAGFAVGKLGGSLSDAQWLFQRLSSQGSETHPNQSARLEAVAVGWRDATGGGTLANSGKPSPKPKASTPTLNVPNTRLVDQASDFVSWHSRFWSQDNSIVIANIANTFANSVYFYGNSRSRSQVMAEKIAFAERWPVRDYTFRPNRSASYCDNSGTCTVSGEVDWYAHSPKRNKTARGTSSYIVGVRKIGNELQIVSEDGKVLSRK